ncbi:MAG: hypothetical protein E7283_10060 [Lachnospiraceae bacterium]|nr:hypothetical protein [Lachnospiraceae bacterium]
MNTPGITIADIPAYSGKDYIVINNNIPNFAISNSTEAYEYYSDLDSLKRCGVAYGCIGIETMPPEGDERGSLSYNPSGWIQKRYSCIPGGWLWNRSHLIAWSLSDEDNNKLNLITGTKHMNQNVMTDFEAIIRDYIKETGNHVMLRVTPIYEGNNLVATGVQIEAWSVEDNGEDICINVFCYNIQPGVVIDYATGESRLATSDDPTYIAKFSNDSFLVIYDTTDILLGTLVPSPKHYAA